MTFRKVIDWDRADPYDRDWRYTFAQLCAAHRRHVDRETIQVKFSHDLALCTVAEIEYYRQLRNPLRNLRDRLIGLLTPWDYEGSFEEVVMPSLAQAYAAHYGDPNDPTIAAQIDATADLIERQNRGEA
jgi:hypothetical protein